MPLRRPIQRRSRKRSNYGRFSSINAANAKVFVAVGCIHSICCVRKTTHWRNETSTRLMTIASGTYCKRRPIRASAWRSGTSSTIEVAQRAGSSAR